MNTVKLVTLTTFQQIAAAKLVQNKLREAGIDSFIADGEVITTDWLLSNALGGIKLQVKQNELETAREVIAERLDDTEIAQMAAEAGDLHALEGDDPPETPLNEREQLVESAWRGSWMSLMFPPMYFFIAWLLIKVYFREEPINAKLRKRLWFAVALTVPWVLAGCTVISLLLREVLVSLFKH